MVEACSAGRPQTPEAPERQAGGSSPTTAGGVFRLLATNVLIKRREKTKTALDQDGNVYQHQRRFFLDLKI